MTAHARAYYNEFDPFAAAWLRELIKAGHIAPGEVDERSIEDVLPTDLRGFTQCHFFAGIGVWSYALRQAGWPDDRPVWTGSCPCQPFSAAGQRKGTADERHLWPSFFHLIEQTAPVTLFGEQVASKDGLTWLDTVSSDLEGAGYTFGAVDTCAAGFGAPHIRQRLYFVADASKSDQHKRSSGGQQPLRQPGTGGLRLENTGSQSARRGLLRPREGAGETDQWAPSELERPSLVSDQLGDTHNTGPQGRGIGGHSPNQRTSRPSSLVNGFWGEADWIYCRDQKYRPVEPGTFPLAHGATNRVGRLRGYGNAIVAPVAQAFIEAFLETERELNDTNY